MTTRSKLDPATLCAHAGIPRSPDPGEGPSSHVSPLYQVSVFDFPSIRASLPALAGDGYAYRREGVPNSDELGAAVAALEGAPAGLATSSGMGAIAATVFALCHAGDRVVVQRDAYGGSRALFDSDLRRLGIEPVYANAYDPDALSEALDGACAALVETLSNPLLEPVDVRALAERCRQRGAALVVDNTFSTPLRDRPLDRGAALVVHSATKFLGGHSDLLAGAVVGEKRLVSRIRGVATRLGLGASPMDAWLAVRGLRTLAVRMERAWQTAADLAARLAGRARVASAKRCALVALDLGDADAADRFVDALELVTLSPSLGGVTTTCSHPASSSHRAVPPEDRARAGIGDGLIRISVGLEHPDDLWRDLDRALRAAGR